MSKRDDILEAAQEVFGAKGYGDTTMKMVSESAGVAFGLVAHYFGNKENLFLTAGTEMVDRVIDRVHADMQGAPDGRAALLTLVRSYLAFTLENRRTFPILIRCSPFSDFELPAVKQAITEKFREIITSIQDSIERGVADGSLREVPARDTAFIIYGAIVGAVRTMMLTPYDRPELYDRLVEFVDRSVAPCPPCGRDSAEA